MRTRDELFEDLLFVATTANVAMNSLLTRSWPELEEELEELIEKAQGLLSEVKSRGKNGNDETGGTQ